MNVYFSNKLYWISFKIQCLGGKGGGQNPPTTIQQIANRAFLQELLFQAVRQAFKQNLYPFTETQ